MSQRGQVFELKTGRGGRGCWAYRYRLGGRDARRVQRGGFATEQAAAEALERALDQLRREQGRAEAPTLAELVDLYLAQHDGEPARRCVPEAKSVLAFERSGRFRPPGG